MALASSCFNCEKEAARATSFLDGGLPLDETRIVSMAKAENQSRLDRLLQIVDTGSTPATRKVAAEQIGAVQQQHPHELYNLLRRYGERHSLLTHHRWSDRLQPLLRSKSWASRTAAAQAVDCIVGHVPPWEPDVTAGSEVKNEPREDDNDGMLTLAEFDIERVVEHGVALLGSSGDQYDLDVSGMSQKASLQIEPQPWHGTYVHPRCCLGRNSWRSSGGSFGRGSGWTGTKTSRT